MSKECIGIRLLSTTWANIGTLANEVGNTKRCLPYSIILEGELCDAAQDLQRCITPLMHLKGDDILEALLLGAAGNEPRTSLTMAEETALLGDDPTPQGAQMITTHPSNHPEETHEPKGAAELE